MRDQLTFLRLTSFDSLHSFLWNLRLEMFTLYVAETGRAGLALYDLSCSILHLNIVPVFFYYAIEPSRSYSQRMPTALVVT